MISLEVQRAMEEKHKAEQETIQLKLQQEKVKENKRS